VAHLGSGMAKERLDKKQTSPPPILQTDDQRLHDVRKFAQPRRQSPDLQLVDERGISCWQLNRFVSDYWETLGPRGWQLIALSFLLLLSERFALSVVVQPRCSHLQAQARDDQTAPIRGGLGRL
jgi:hypothetical protein